MMDDEPLVGRGTRYRALAHRAYANAQRMQDPAQRLIMQEFALSYENLASQTEQREREAAANERLAKATSPSARLGRLMRG